MFTTNMEVGQEITIPIVQMRMVINVKQDRVQVGKSKSFFPTKTFF